MDPLADRATDETLPLGDIRVIEMGFGVAGPFLARNLGHFGADVIRVESARRPDSLRLGGAGWLPPEGRDVIASASAVGLGVLAQR